MTYPLDIKNAIKVYVSVTATFSPDGKIKPVSIIWEDGRHYEIDETLDVRRSASLKAGCAGIRYTIRIGAKSTYLFLEDGRWFVERRVNWCGRWDLNPIERSQF